MTYKYYNNNPNNKKVGDCVIRAISLALGVSWERVFEDLVSIARVQKSVPTWKDVYFEYLKIYPTINVKYQDKNGNTKRLTPKLVCDMSGIYIIKVANHLTVVKEGCLMDIWDCSDKAAYKIWRIK